MGFKHLVGFCLLILGLGLAPLFVVFAADSQSLNPVFLLGLGLCAVSFFFSGLYIINKSG
jgi:hypothetical protein